MNFYLRHLQVIRRRNKTSKPCYDWRHYDNLMMKEISEKIGCRPVYWGHQTHFPMCISPEKMGAFEPSFYKRYFGSKDSLTEVPPCIEPEDMRIEFSDVEAKDQKKIDEHNIDSNSRHEAALEWFKVRLWFRSNQFMEIKQIKAYNFESLAGNSGGYVGLILGYSIVQSPKTVTNFYYILKTFIISRYF